MTISLSLDEKLERDLEEFCAQAGVTAREAVEDAIRRKLKLFRFKKLQRKVAGAAERAGYSSEEDLLGDIS